MQNQGPAKTYKRRLFVRVSSAALILAALILALQGSSRAASPDEPPDVFHVLPDDPSQGIRLEGALVFRDLRIERDWAVKRRNMLMETTVGAAFYEPGAQKEAFGYNILAELEKITDLAAPSGGPVSGGLAAFTGPDGVGLQALLKVEEGLLSRLAAALESPAPPAWKGRVRGDTVEIDVGGETVTGSVDESGWLRLSVPGSKIPQGSGGVSLEGPIGRWTDDCSGLVLLRGGGEATAAMADDVGAGPGADILGAMRMAVVCWKFDDDRTTALRFIFDSPPLQPFVPMVRSADLTNSLGRIWDDDATGFLSLSLPPAALTALPVLLQQTLMKEDIGLPLSFFQATGALEGRIGLVSFGSPGDLALGINFKDESMAETFVSSIHEWQKNFGGKEPNPLVFFKADYEEFPGSVKPVLHLRTGEGLEGIRVAAIGSTVIVVFQKGRLEALFAHRAALEKDSKTAPSQLAGPVTPMMRETLDAPAMLLSYMTLGDTDFLFWYLKSISWALSSGVANANRLPGEAPHVSRFVERLPMIFTLAGIVGELTYDVAITADVQQSLLVVQLVRSYL